MLSMIASVIVLATVDMRCALGGDFWCDVGKRERKQESTPTVPRSDVPAAGNWSVYPSRLPVPETIPKDVCLYVESELPVILVFLGNQEMITCENGKVVWHNGVELRGVISSGGYGHATQPTKTRYGLETVSWMSKNHVSEQYDASMPNAIFLSREGYKDKGVALHAGNVIHSRSRWYYGASHGCIRISWGLSEALYDFVWSRHYVENDIRYYGVRVLVVMNMHDLKRWS